MINVIKFFLIAIIITSMGCTNSGNKVTSEISIGINEIKRIVSKYDSLFRKREKRYLKVYVQIKDSNHFVEVKNLSSFPKNVSETMNILYNDNKNIVAIKDIPTSESGDFFNTITYYFYSNGNTMAFKTNSSFFSENCKIDRESDSRITEITIKYFDNQFNLLGSDYSLTDTHNNKIDSSKCNLNYAIDAKPLKSVNIIHQLKQL